MTEERQPTRVELIVYRCPTCGVWADATGVLTEPPRCHSGDEEMKQVLVVPASDLDKALAALRESVEFAEEGWAYASDYFREKWEAEKRLADLYAALKALDGLREPA